MDIKLQKKLFKKYPKIFKQTNSLITQSCMGFGVETPSSWYWIIDNLCNSIQTYINNNKHLKIEQLQFTQLKEKFGTGRFYYQGGDRKIDGMIQLAENMTSSICACCGSINDIKETQGWISFLCSNCFNKKECI